MSNTRLTVKQTNATNTNDFQAALSLWNELKEAANMNADEFLIEVVNAYVSSKNSQYTKEEMSIINDAVRLSGDSFEDIQKVGTLYRAKYLRTNEMKKRDGEHDMSELVADLSSNVKGVAEARIDNEVNRLMDFNKDVNEGERYRITKTLIFRRTGANYPAINKYFDENESMIDRHHENLNIGLRANRTKKGERLPLPEYRN